MELALEWEESQRKVMYDPSKADYFLQYTDGKGNKNGTIYNEGIEFGDQFFWDYTNKEAVRRCQFAQEEWPLATNAACALSLRRRTTSSLRSSPRSPTRRWTAPSRTMSAACPRSTAP